jgi:hypothetical protein
MSVQINALGLEPLPAIVAPTIPTAAAAAPQVKVEFAPGFMAQKAAAVEVPFDARGEIERFMMPRPASRCGWLCRNKRTVLIGAGVAVVLGAVGYMLLRPTRGLRPAMAGLHGRRRRRRR